MPEEGLMHRASPSLLSKGPGGQDLFPSPIYLEPSSTEEVGKAWFTVVASLSSMKPASDDEGQGKELEEKGRNKGESGIAPPPVCQSGTHLRKSPISIVGGLWQITLPL